MKRWKSVEQMKRQIAAWTAQLERTTREINSVPDVPGPFVTGRSNYSRTLSLQLDRANDKRIDLFKTQSRLEADIKWLTARIALVEAGEVHLNGQPRADAPSRLRTNNFRTEYAAFVKSLLKPGIRVALLANLRSQIQVKRINKKTVTDEMGEKWDYNEILPLDSTGKPMETETLIEMYKTWKGLPAE